MKKIDFIILILLLYSISLFFSIAITEICLGILIFFIIMKMKNREIKLKNFEFGIFFLLFIISVDISLFYKFFILKTMNLKIKKFFGGWLFFSFYASLFFIKEKNLAKKILNIMIIACTISAIYGLYYVKYIAKINYPNLSFYDIGARGFYSHSLTSANIWAILLILTIFMLYKTKKKLYLIPALIIFFGLIFTFRRGPILYFLITFFIMNLCFFKKKGIVINFIAMLIISASFILNKGLNKRVKMLFNFKNNPCSSTNIRLFLWKTSLKLIKKYPIFGVPKKFKKVIRKYTNLKCQQRGHPHNGFLTILVYYGIFPFIIFISLFINLIKFLFVNLNKNEFALLGLLIVVLYLLESLTENNFGDSEVKLVFWFILGICILGIKKRWKFQ